MFTYRQIVAVSTITILSLLGPAGCTIFSPADGQAATETESTVANESNINEMARLVADLKSDAGIGDYESAKVTLSQLQTVWETLEAKIKIESPAAHEAIEIHMSSVANDLQATQPDAALLASDIQLLETVVAGLP